MNSSVVVLVKPKVLLKMSEALFSRIPHCCAHAISLSHMAFFYLLELHAGCTYVTVVV